MFVERGGMFAPQEIYEYSSVPKQQKIQFSILILFLLFFFFLYPPKSLEYQLRTIRRFTREKSLTKGTGLFQSGFSTIL